MAHDSYPIGYQQAREHFSSAFLKIFDARIDYQQSTWLGDLFTFGFSGKHEAEIRSRLYQQLVELSKNSSKCQLVNNTLCIGALRSQCLSLEDIFYMPTETFQFILEPQNMEKIRKDKTKIGRERAILEKKLKELDETYRLVSDRLQETIDNVKLQIAEEQNRIRVIQDENLKIITNNMLDQTSDTLKENAKKIVVAQDKLEELNEQLKKENDTLMKENKEKYDKKRPISARLNALQTMIEKLRRAGYAYRSLGEIFSSAPEPSPVETITPPIDQIPAQIKTPERKDPVLKSTSKQVITYTGALKALEDKCRKLQDLGVKDKTQKLIDFIQKVNRECSISTSSLIDALSQTTLLLDEKLSPKDYSTYAYATFATKGSNSATSYAPKVMRTLGVMMMALGIAVALSGTIIAAVTLGLLTSLTVPIGVIVAGTVIGGLGLTSFAMGALLGVFAPNQRGKGLYSAMDSLQSEIRWQSHV